VKNLLSVDVEEYFQVEGFADVVDRRDWVKFESRVRMQTLRLLDLFDGKRQKATFFVLAWTAERDPDLVREIVARGHELASHGFSHRMIDTQGARAFRRDVRKGKRVLEKISGAPVAGYRAPSFSITARTPWAHRVLAEEGFTYSSSVFPVRHDRYGVPDAPRRPYEVDCGDGRRLVELPPLTMRVLGQNLPVAGGGYMRLFPTKVVSSAIASMNKAGAPAVVYLHPWEIDPEQPKLPGRASNRWRHWVGMAKLEKKLSSLLDAHSFGTMGEFLGLPAQKLGAPAPIVSLDASDVDSDDLARAAS
jgi:polysaccharide deacetylase family protein (PEP-CTERM system associated)